MSVFSKLSVFAVLVPVCLASAVLPSSASAIGIERGDSADIRSVSELAERFKFAEDAETIALTHDLTGTVADAAVSVAAGQAVTLDLAGHSLTLLAADDFPGLGVRGESTLTVVDSGHGGVLSADGGFGCAGIGGDGDHIAGRIQIDSGTVVARGGAFAAGIGGGSSNLPGSVTVNSGTVIATGGFGGAGIGGGRFSDGPTRDPAGLVTINSGTVTAVGGQDAAGIGGGAYGSGGVVIINSGTVTATGGPRGAGIGSGEGAWHGGTITITGGSVTATGGHRGAGIGSAATSAYIEPPRGKITVTGGVVSATSGDGGAGIGGGAGGPGAEVRIDAGTVVATATGVDGGAGIGGGQERGLGGSLMITGGTVTAAANGGYPIGGGAPEKWFGSLSNAGVLTVRGRLKIPAETSVVNTGTLINDGELRLEGVIKNSGSIVNTGTIEGSDQIRGHNVAVSLDANGGVAPPGSPHTIYAGSFTASQVPFPSAATRAGGTSTGWYTAPAGGTQVTAETDLGTDGPKTMTLYAQWETRAVTVTFDTREGSVVAPVVVDYNTPVAEPTAPTRSGYDFTGWYTAATGGDPWTFTTPVTTTMTLFAHWKANTVALAASGADPTGWSLLGVILFLTGGVALILRSLQHRSLEDHRSRQRRRNRA